MIRRPLLGFFGDATGGARAPPFAPLRYNVSLKSPLYGFRMAGGAVVAVAKALCDAAG